MVAGIILAAGRSTRMGTPKALLLASDGLTFVARLIRTLVRGGIEAPLVVGRLDDEALQAEVESAGARLVINPDADEGGQLSSLLAGLRKADRPGVRGLLVTPVDAPMVRPATVARLIGVFSETSGAIIRARYQGRNGHPVIVSRSLFEELHHVSRDAGAKAVLRAHQDAIINVDTDDPGVVADIDTPEDYRKLVD
jgi:CTP:molybdopterin cytidylyltransferase MocA